jgi:hypothetical protein
MLICKNQDLTLRIASSVTVTSSSSKEEVNKTPLSTFGADFKQMFSVLAKRRKWKDIFNFQILVPSNGNFGLLPESAS